MDFRVIVTLGPSIMDEAKLRTIDAFGRCIYRINGAHADAAAIPPIAQFVRKVLPQAPLMIDLPGNKVRLHKQAYPIRLINNQVFRLNPQDLNFPDFYKHVSVGDVIYANDSKFRMQVEEVVKEGDKGVLVIRSFSDGLLQGGKGFHVRGAYKTVPFLFQRDLELIDAACELKLDILSLSFVRTAADVKEAKAILSKKGVPLRIFAKVETMMAVENLGPILQEVETINLDRGDLSSDVGIIRLPILQERIIDSAQRAKREIFLATQFLKNMEEHPVPLIAEIVDLYKTIRSGINGIQLSEETAVGKYPVECVKQVFDVYSGSFGI